MPLGATSVTVMSPRHCITRVVLQKNKFFAELVIASDIVFQSVQMLLESKIKALTNVLMN